MSINELLNSVDDINNSRYRSKRLAVAIAILLTVISFCYTAFYSVFGNFGFS